MTDYTPVKEYLLKHGWHKGGLWPDGVWHDEDSPVCVLGACMRTETPIEWSLLSRIAQEQFPDLVDQWAAKAPVAQANDHPDSTLEDIFLILDKAEHGSL
jgi:hypothetical protein